MSAIEEPIALTDDDVLDQLNLVRTRMGWEPLSHLPLADPSDGCRCVLGRSWAILVDPVSLNDNKYDTVNLYSREGGPNGSLLEAMADVLDGDLTRSEHPREGREYDCASVRGDHPLMRWMWRFDHHELHSLIDQYATDPLNLAYMEDFTLDDTEGDA